MMPEFRLRELEEERVRLLEQIEQQKTVVVFLAKCFGKALSERDKARELCVAMEAEADVYGVSLLGPAGYEPRGAYLPTGFDGYPNSGPLTEDD